MNLKIWQFFLLFSLPFWQLLKIPFLLPALPEANFYFGDLLALVVSFTFLINFKKQPQKLKKMDKAFLAFGGAATLSLFFNLSFLDRKEALTAFFYLLRLWSFIGVFFSFSKTSFSQEEKKIFLALLVGGGIFAAITGFLQYWLYPDLSPLTSLGWDPHLYRLAGLLFDPNFTGLYLVFTFLILTSFFFSPKVKNKKGVLFLMAISYVALALTYSRSSYLALLIGIFFLLWWQKKRLLFIFFGAFFALTLIFLPKPAGEGVNLSRTSTVHLRLENYQEGLSLFAQKPIFGWGFNAYRYAREKALGIKEDIPQHSGAGNDASLIFILATTGILGFFFFFKTLLEMLFSFPPVNLKNHVLLALILAFLVHSFFNNSLFYPPLALFLLSFLGMALAKNHPLS